MGWKHGIVRFLNRHLLARHRLAIRKSGHEAENAVLTEAVRARMANQVADLVLPYFRGLLPAGEPLQASDLAQDVAAFMALHERRPVRDNSGGMGFNGSLWLYLFVRRLKPDLIVESGTWQGHSAWLMAEVAPEAEIVTCDIEHDNLSVRHPRVRYLLGDWTEHRIAAPPSGRSLMFFDDHVSHARRLREASARGFTQVLFDDDVPVNGVFLTGEPPLPSLAMLHDSRFGPGDAVEWRYRDRKFRFEAKAEDWRATDLIESYRPVPPLWPASPYREHLGLSFVRLRGAMPA